MDYDAVSEAQPDQVGSGREGADEASKGGGSQSSYLKQIFSLARVGYLVAAHIQVSKQRHALQSGSERRCARVADLVAAHKELRQQRHALQSGGELNCARIADLDAE